MSQETIDEKPAGGNSLWSHAVRDAFCATRDTDMGEYVEIPLTDWERLKEAITTPVYKFDPLKAEAPNDGIDGARRIKAPVERITNDEKKTIRAPVQ